ncbi:hypothetical protein NTGHW29_430013 [Candidatus Nitrotoga sp. HW29]|nr:hypothetical protein NTGHW29_430013 [Candidatus Nitrotoga sp. HW29]
MQVRRAPAGILALGTGFVHIATRATPAGHPTPGEAETHPATSRISLRDVLLEFHVVLVNPSLNVLTLSVVPPKVFLLPTSDYRGQYPRLWHLVVSFLSCI